MSDGTSEPRREIEAAEEDEAPSDDESGCSEDDEEERAALERERAELMEQLALFRNIASAGPLFDATAAGSPATTTDDVEDQMLAGSQIETQPLAPGAARALAAPPATGSLPSSSAKMANGARARTRSSAGDDNEDSDDQDIDTANAFDHKEERYRDNEETARRCAMNLGDEVVRAVARAGWFFLVANVHFALLPYSYVRNSMINGPVNRLRKRAREDGEDGGGWDANDSKTIRPRSTTTTYSAMQNFLRSEGHVGLFPRPRVVLVLVLGVALFVLVAVATQDEFIFGPVEPEPTFPTTSRPKENSTVLPVEVSFENVGCTVPGLQYPILHNVSGTIPAGQITGILGPSGAGKSTLGAILMGRGDRMCKPTTGTVFLNGEEQSLNVILDRVGFVPQSDALLEDLTVEESLLFSASWRLPWHFTEKDRREALEETLELLDLENIRHERIGGLNKRGISGGEKKRVSIGVELIASPSVLVMDEPTSGLDGAAAFKLMRRLRNIANRKGVSVVVVLHVPSARVFQLLDNLILLQHGEAVYVGPRQDVVTLWERIGVRLRDHAHLQLTTPELLLDVLAGVIPYPDHICPFDKAQQQLYGDATWSCANLPTLPQWWRSLPESAAFSFSEAGPRLAGDPDEEDCEDVPKRFNGRKRCENRRLRRIFPRVAKPGLLRQVWLWIDVLGKFMVRRGVFFEALSTIMIAIFSAWVRSYSNSWDSRAMAALIVSVTIAALGSFSAVFQDNAPPVKRAADSGMVLGAHHNALVALGIFRSFCVANLFAIAYHLTLWVRTGDRKVLALWRHSELSYIILLGYCVNWAVAALMCVFAQHDFRTTCVLTIGYLLWTHVFAMYSPNKRQIELDSHFMENRFQLKRIIRQQCAMSPARYYIEAIVLWDKVPHSDNGNGLAGRQFVLDYFGYRDEDLSTCLSTLVVFFLSLVIIRWFVFGYVNSSDFHTLYDQPLFLKFYLKLQFSLSLSLAMLLAAREKGLLELVARRVGGGSAKKEQ
ncbi:Putative white-brown complex homolog protein 30 (Putative non-intrinsic ABC protein 12) (WBC-related protein 1) [Durusdinium trenchii]|uniref:White-brown complex homolog protein 30 (Putative non-intrinsic ABC protein 12) (WBC-related protein 1) n=1 Tax=Durusdinium trenchii TaxID=1381693 RepID=A0ABP0JGL9_9DINO